MPKYEVTIKPTGLGFFYVVDAEDSSMAVAIALHQLENEAGDPDQVDSWVQTILKRSQLDIITTRPLKQE